MKSYRKELWFEAPQRREQRQELLHGAHALLAHAAVGGEARHREAEHQRAGLGGDEAELRGLRDHGAVRRVAAQQRRQRARAAVLLTHDAGHAQTAAQAQARLTDRASGLQRAGQAALHVHGAAAVDPAVAHGRVKGRRRPGRLLAHRHDVDVAVQHEVATAAPLPDPADHAERLVALHLVAPVRVSGQHVEVGLPLVDCQTGVSHPRGDGALCGGFASVEAGNGDQTSHQRDEGVDIEGVEGAPLEGAQRAWSSWVAGRRHGAPPLRRRRGERAS